MLRFIPLSLAFHSAVADRFISMTSHSGRSAGEVQSPAQTDCERRAPRRLSRGRQPGPTVGEWSTRCLKRHSRLVQLSSSCLTALSLKGFPTPVATPTLDVHLAAAIDVPRYGATR